MKGLKITLDLEQDPEIRDYVKSLIAGQVRSVSREEIHAMVAACIKEKFPDITREQVILEIRTQITQVTGNTVMSGGARVNYLKEVIREEVRALLKESAGDIQKTIQEALTRSFKL